MRKRSPWQLLFLVILGSILLGPRLGANVEKVE